MLHSIPAATMNRAVSYEALAIRSHPAAASFRRSPYVRVTGFGCGLLNFRINLAADEDSCACEIEPQQKGGHWLKSRIDPFGRAEAILVLEGSTNRPWLTRIYLSQFRAG
jgi:hypothetical protein